MSWKQRLLRAAAHGVSILRSPFPEKHGLRIMMFHAIGSSRVHGDPQGLNAISVERFTDFVEVLKSFRTVPLFPLGIADSALSVAVSFDDGYADNLHVAAPLLLDAGIPFTVFVATDCVRSRASGFLSPEELQELSNMAGVTIGSHGCSHTALTKCSDGVLAFELNDSRSYLEDLLGHEVLTISYPYGAADRRVRSAAAAAGYVIGACSRLDINGDGRDDLMLNRCVVLRDDSPRVFRQKIEGDWDWYRFRNLDPLRV